MSRKNGGGDNERANAVLAEISDQPLGAAGAGRLDGFGLRRLVRDYRPRADSIVLRDGELRSLTNRPTRSFTKIPLAGFLLGDRSIVFRNLFPHFFVFRDFFLFARRWMRPRIAIAGIKEQAAADDCAKH